MRWARLAIIGACLAASGCGSDPAPPAQQSQPQTPPPVAVSETSQPARGSDWLPLPDVPFPPARPRDVVEAVFHFAGDHPEVLSHIPCFCGCENRGHRNNDDCFVAARDERGRVTAWEPHGIG
jgi:hypothetical protein